VFPNSPFSKLLEQVSIAPGLRIITMSIQLLGASAYVFIGSSSCKNLGGEGLIRALLLLFHASLALGILSFEFALFLHGKPGTT